MKRVRLAALRRAVIGLSVAACVGAQALPVHAALSTDDKRVLAEMALQWALAGGLPDVKLLKDPANLLVANFNLPRDVELKIPARTVTIASLTHIQARADRHGDLLYFRFDRFKGDDVHAGLELSLVWAVSVQSKNVYLSGGGATLEFEKTNGQWQLGPVASRWTS